MATKQLDLTQFEGHTPGPWRFEVTPQKVRNIEPRIATAWSQEDGRNNAYMLIQTDRNAALLAAAPDLLAECKRLRSENARLRETLHSIEQSAHPDADIPHTEYEWAMSLVEQARAALAATEEK
jgi:hypothetical protein